jgi:D-alanyl-D-alanine carboxypeptidase
MMEMLRRILSVFLAASLALALPADADAKAKRKRATPVNKYAAFVVEADTGQVLFARYADEKRHPASLTKMMTLYLLFEEIDAGRLTLASELSVSAVAAGQAPSKLGLVAGTTIDAETAIKALVVRSANDAAVVIAEAISGSEWKFAQKMTEKAHELGMSRTTFRNASGLPNVRQVTTARDLATLGRRLARDFPQYYHYFDTSSFAWNGRTYRTHNAVAENYPGAEGLKTGYTRMSGFNLATAAKRDGHRLVAVVLGGKSVRSRDAHMRELLDKTFAAIAGNPALVAEIPGQPTPRLKPTLLAKLEAERAVPTIAESDAIRQTLIAAADLMSADEPASDPITGLIASVSADAAPGDVARRANAAPMEALWGEGDADAPGASSWSVQIGAYSSKSMAEDELAEAAKAGGFDTRARGIEPMLLSDGSALYRARFTTLTATDAAAVCETLRAKSISCFVVQDGAAAAAQ